MSLIFDHRGMAIEIPKAAEDMADPVQCHCGGIYDLATVSVTQRYADCSMWHAPCCDRLSDDRVGLGAAHYRKLRP